MSLSPARASRRRPAAGRRLLITIAAIAIGGFAYMLFKPQVQAGLAGGTQWILEVCGFDPKGAAPASDRLRQIWYAIRMFEAAPPKDMEPEDQRAALAYPNMGFGTLRTFSRTPARVVIGDWLYSIPRTYFFDARDGRDGPAGLLRLRVLTEDFAPIRQDRIGDFLAAVSPNVLRITLAGADHAAPTPDGAMRRPEWDRPGYRAYAPRETAAKAYRLYVALEAPFPGQQIRCTDPAWSAEKGIMPHCILRFRHAGDLEAGLFFSEEHFNEWLRLRQGADALLLSFRGRGLEE